MVPLPIPHFIRVVLIALAAWVGPMPGVALASEPLTRIGDVRLMSRETTGRGLPVHVRGVVTWRNGRDNLTVQDDSGGIWIEFVEARARGVWRGDNAVLDKAVEGMEVEIEGRIDPGGYAPMILASALRILGAKPLPPAASMVASRFFSGADDCQRIEVSGVVQRFYPQGDWVILVLDANPGRFTSQVSRAVAADPAALVDAEVRLRGVAATRFNTRGEATGSRMFSNVPGELIVTKPPPQPDAVTRVTLDRLLPFRPEALGPHRVRVAGTVTYSLPGRFLYMQDGINAVRVETTSSLALKAGDRVEVAGFVFMYRFIGSLRDATVRKTGAAALPEPVEIRPGQILALNRAAVEAAQVAPHDYDGHLIRCRARLLAVESGLSGKATRTLTLEQTGATKQDNLIFRAQLYDGNAGSLDALLPGSELEVTGLVELEFAATEIDNEGPRTAPVGLGLILRGESDVVVIQKPSWWTARNSIAVVAAVLLALGGALLWSFLLKRQVRRKSVLLAQEINARRDAAIEFRTTMRERNRLAANLHDTLPQSMSGIGLQLDACEFSLRKLGINSLPPLEVARRMVEYAISELRGAVWEMRSLSLRGRDFTAALQAVVDQAVSGYSTRITVHTEGPLERIPDVVSGNLLLIVQEALRNALQHGKPTIIDLAVFTEAPGAPIHLDLRDDGSGFTPGSQKGPEQGHYGIVGMRERAERLGGSLRVESSPGQGTRIVALVCQDDDDNYGADENLTDETTLADPPMVDPCRPS
jgi:signal transduction histidine kinase